MRQILLFPTIIFLAGCAQIIPLTGGDKDLSAPTIISEKSTPQQGQLNYSSSEVVLVFNEYIKLNNPLNNISITPQPTVPPTISSKNKKFKLVFNDPMLPNTTYSITFNGAIADLNEGNDSVFQYVFSTGSFIDSLSFSGSVQHAYTNKAVANVLVGLYPIPDSAQTHNDSIPFTSKPTYIAQSDKSGQFRINYIKNGRYQAFAFTDQDRNLLYNSTNEKIGFLENLNCCRETNSDSNIFRLFEPIKSERGLKSSSLNYPGQLVLVFNEKTPKNVLINYDIPLVKEHGTRKDSLTYWLTKPYKNLGEFIVIHGLDSDTIRPIMKNLPKKEAALNVLTATNNLHEGKLLPSDTLSFTFKEPFQITDKNKIKVLDKDSNAVAYSLLISNVRTLIIKPENDSARYITIDSAALRSQLTSAVNNTIISKFQRHPSNYYGILKVDLKADSSSNYLLELLNAKGEVVVQKSINKTTKSTTFKKLLPANYQLRLIKDDDENGQWTTGDLLKKQQPESVYYYTTPIKIRSNWEMEIEWIVDGQKP